MSSVSARKSNVVVSGGETSTNDNSSVVIDEGEGAAREAEIEINPRDGDRIGGPPVDDCCPICFGSFTVPCKANCGHWFCGSVLILLVLLLTVNRF